MSFYLCLWLFVSVLKEDSLLRVCFQSSLVILVLQKSSLRLCVHCCSFASSFCPSLPLMLRLVCPPSAIPIESSPQPCQRFVVIYLYLDFQTISTACVLKVDNKGLLTALSRVWEVFAGAPSPSPHLFSFPISHSRC